MSHPQIFTGSDEELVYGAVRKLQPASRNAIAAMVGLLPTTVSDLLKRLRLAGLCYCLIKNRGSWAIGRDPAMRSVGTDRVGLRSAMRHVFHGGGVHTPEKLAIRFGVPIASVMTEIGKMLAAADIVRDGPIENQRERIVYRARQMHTGNIARAIGFEPGEGDRRDDCARYEWCLFSYGEHGQAHCAENCPGFQLVSADRLREAAMVRRKTQWSETAV